MDEIPDGLELRIQRLLRLLNFDSLRFRQLLVLVRAPYHLRRIPSRLSTERKEQTLEIRIRTQNPRKRGSKGTHDLEAGDLLVDAIEVLLQVAELELT